MTNWRIHTPICAPSRAELASGRYYRHLWSNQTTPSPTTSPGAVNQVDLRTALENHFALHLRKDAGYSTGLWGKCENLNCGTNPYADGFDLHLAGAYDTWFESDSGYYNETFFDTSAASCKWPWGGDGCETATHPGGVWAGRGDGYFTSTIGNLTVEWIDDKAAANTRSGVRRPFHVYFALHAPHLPSTPADWYASGTWCDAVRSPRTPDYNFSGTPAPHTKLPPTGPAPFPSHDPWWFYNSTFHELIASQPPIGPELAAEIDGIASDRCKTLLSVDEAYAAIYRAVERAGELNRTYFIVTSDHGYNLGQHRIPSNKMLPYEHSLRIPMLFAGPGIEPGNSDFLGTNVDLAPTILSLAGLPIPPDMDGQSVLPLLISDPSKAPPATQRALANLTTPTRTAAFHTYCSLGEFTANDRLEDDWSNTYIAITYQGSHGRYKFALFDPYLKQTFGTTPYMFELFDLDSDPFELNNIYNQTLAQNPQLIQTMNSTLFKYFDCKGTSCQNI